MNMFATTFKCHFQSDHTFLIGAKKIASKGSAYYSYVTLDHVVVLIDHVILFK